VNWDIKTWWPIGVILLAVSVGGVHSLIKASLLNFLIYLCIALSLTLAYVMHQYAKLYNNFKTEKANALGLTQERDKRAKDLERYKINWMHLGGVVGMFCAKDNQLRAISLKEWYSGVTTEIANAEREDEGFGDN
jgi:hypothetical protein